jgi:large subunit ribosomal protein L5
MATQLEPELLVEYKTRVVTVLREKHAYKNIHEVPKVTKVVVNSSVGAGADSKEALEVAKSEIAMITGQRAISTLAKNVQTSARKGQAISAKVSEDV